MDSFDVTPKPMVLTRTHRSADATDLACHRGSRAAWSWSVVLAVATAIAILMSGLNGLVQIVKVLAESGVIWRG